MKKVRRLLGVALVFLMLLPTNIFASDIPPSTNEYYLDQSNVLSNSTEEYIHDQDYKMDKHSGAYIEVVTVEYANMDVLDYAVKLFNEWEIGDSKKDNGILLLVVTQEEKYYVIVGKGLENQLSSYDINKILDQYFKPDFEDGKYDEAVKKTFVALYDKLVGIYGQPTESDEPPKFVVTITLIIVAILFAGLFLFIIRTMFTKAKPTSNYTRNSYSSNRSYSNYDDSSQDNNRRYNSYSSHSSGSSKFSGRSSGGSSRGSGSGRR